jgi:hypothetical protein
VRRFLSIVWTTIVHCTSLFLFGIGSAFSAAGKMANIYFVQLGNEYDAKYAKAPAPPAPKAEEEPEPTNVFELVGDKDFN